MQEEVAQPPPTSPMVDPPPPTSEAPAAEPASEAPAASEPPASSDAATSDAHADVVVAILEPTVLSAIQSAWESVSISGDGRVPCQPFCDAVLATLAIFDCLTGMGSAKGDMLANVNAIARRLRATDSAPGFALQSLCDVEIDRFEGDAARAADEMGSVCNCLLWLKRALRLFEVVGMELMAKDTNKALSSCVSEGYEVALKPHHNCLMQAAFAVAVRASPSREQLLSALSSDEQQLRAVLEEVVPALSGVLRSLQSYFVGRRVETADGLRAKRPT